MKEAKKTEKVVEKVTENEGSSQKILEMIRSDATITTQAMANNLGISRRAVAKTIAKLQEKGFVRRIGADKGGYWEIVQGEDNE